MPASAIGVLNTRSRPNSRCSPSVTRNTPPSSPTSSPNTSVRSSPASASRSAAFNAATIVSSAIDDPALALTKERGGRLGERVIEHLRGRWGPDRDDPGPDLRDPGLRVGLAGRHETLVGDAARGQEPAEAVDRVSRSPPGDLLLVAVAGRVVRGG